jgi:Dolichyl-phosphate-mannose-protein mannosyltransferase
MVVPARSWISFTWCRAVLALCAGALLLSPILRDPSKGWPLGPARRLAFGLAVLTLLVYGARWWRVRLLTGGHALDVFLLGVVPLYALLIGNGGLITSGDNYATRTLGVAIVQRGSLDVSPYPPFRDNPGHYSVVSVAGRLLPSFPLGTGLLSVPYAAVALCFTAGPVTEGLLCRWERHFAALLGCGATVLFFLALRQRMTQSVAVGAAAIFAVATTVFSTAGQAMWSMSGEVFCLTVALYLLLGHVPRPASRSVAAGLALAAAFACRPTAVLAVLAVAGAAIFEDRRALKPLVSTAIVGIAAICVFQYHEYGHILGGYGLLNVHEGLWRWRSFDGIGGNLFSPSRGLFVFFPYVLLVPLAWKRAGKSPLVHWWVCSAAALAGTVAVASCYGKWWGGASLGPRLMTEAAPFLAFLTLPCLSDRGLPIVWRTLFWAAVAFAAATQFLLVYNPAADRWTGDTDVDARPEVLWSLRDGQLAAAWGVGRRIPPQNYR